MVNVVGCSRCQSLEAGSLLAKAAFVDLDARSGTVLGMEMMLHCWWDSTCSIYTLPQTSTFHRRHKIGATHHPVDAYPEPHSVCNQQVARLVAGVGEISARIHPVEANCLAGLAFLAS